MAAMFVLLMAGDNIKLWGGGLYWNEFYTMFHEKPVN
jgi:hypothetical protein